ncbi:MAG: RNA polymerase sigma factor [bacterium]|nr:RNA polymerase sigma factor [bacterium]
MTLNFAGTARLPRKARVVSCDEASELGDKELFLQLLVPVKKHLYNFIRKALNFSHEADDVFQDALLKAFRYFHSFDRDKDFKTWLFTIAHNLVKDHYRTGSMVLLEDADKISIETGVMPEDVREIYAAARDLKPKQREVFFLYYYNNFKVREIVEITGFTKVNVKFMLHQARKSVKKILEVPE